MLNEIGVPYKTVKEYRWVNKDGTLSWEGWDETCGIVEIYLGADAGGVAHEIGHGFHEALNHHRKATLPFPFRWGIKPDDGEAVAEAVRYFVEARLGTGWRPVQDHQVLNGCNYGFATFREMVRRLVL